MSHQKRVWIIEGKPKQNKRWRTSVDHIPFTNGKIAKLTAEAKQERNPDWLYRAVPFVREAAEEQR